MKLVGDGVVFDTSVFRDDSSLWREVDEPKAYEYPPLELRRSRYQDAGHADRWDHTGQAAEHSHTLEVEEYRIRKGSLPILVNTAKVFLKVRLNSHTRLKHLDNTAARLKRNLLNWRQR